MASEAIVGTDSIVGFDVNGASDRAGRGVTSLLNAVDRGEHTRDILQALRFEGRATHDDVAEVNVAVEKIGAAALLATEKTSAAVNLAIEKVGAAGQLANAQQFAALQFQAAQLAAEAARQAAECCCETKELIREEAGKTRDLVNTIESNRVRDLLADAKSEILALRLAGTGNGNGK